MARVVLAIVREYMLSRSEPTTHTLSGAPYMGASLDGLVGIKIDGEECSVRHRLQNRTILPGIRHTAVNNSERNYAFSCGFVVPPRSQLD